MGKHNIIGNHGAFLRVLEHSTCFLAGTNLTVFGGGEVPAQPEVMRTASDIQRQTI